MRPATTPPDPPPSDPSIGQIASCTIGATLWSAPLFLLMWTATLALYPALAGAASAARGPVVFILAWGAIFIGYLQIYGDRNAGWTALDRVLVNPDLSLGKTRGVARERGRLRLPGVPRRRRDESCAVLRAPYDALAPALPGSAPWHVGRISAA